MTLTTTTTSTKTDAELLALLSAMTMPQQNILRQGYDAYVNRRLCFWVKWPASKADAQSLIPEYLTEVAPGQFQLTDLGVNLYRAWLHQPLARPNADKQPQGYHGTRHSRNRNLRDMWEQKVPNNGLTATTLEPAKDGEQRSPLAEAAATDRVSATPATSANEPVSASAKGAENLQPLVPPPPPQPPVPSTPPAVVQLDLTAFMQPLLAEIEALKAQLAAQPAPPPKPVARRKSRAAMPMAVLV
ncbi:MAG: hypothetical protein K8L91_08695 [Anaerolineae bacterium]|nr:hypothetical protein [Anaerolineae bacterium]